VHPVLAEIFGPDLIIVIIVAAIVIFGGSRIPKLARSLGSAQSEFKKGLAEGHSSSGDQAASQPGQAAAPETGGSSSAGGPPAQ
jgi:sec-independent protein translocase protein TatA